MIYENAHPALPGYENHPLMKDRTAGMKFLGYWTDHGYPRRLGTKPSERIDLPRPENFVDESWDPAERALVASYLRAGREWEQWRGDSWCRFLCGASMGYRDLTDGTYVWPEGFAHYIEEHAVRPPQEFIDHVRGRQ